MGARPAKRDANKILEEMATDMSNMFQWKTEHVRRIAQRAEELAANYSASDAQLPFEFYNAKKVFDERDGPPSNLIEQSLREQHQWKGLSLRRSPLFGRTPVSFEESAVHVPVNVFEGNVGLRTPIKWSGSLKDVFRNNRVIDPDVYWQYFCSANGFMRLYPAAIWRVPDLLQTPDHERKPLDMYDCRMRNWFVRAAASAKDVVILLDGSGSMSGQRKEIARNVVTHILDTLGDDDHVAVLRFSDHIQPVVSCFGDRLVQANAQNVRRFKQNLTVLNTTDIANFSLALRTAFTLLKNSTSQRLGSNCNQAIMLVTDGAPGNDRLDHRTIFEEFNYPRIDIRVFSYLVGKEVTDTKEVNWMACANRGYYTHVASLAEIREQVQLYLPVMARPLVLARDRVYGFTPVYADVMDVPLTNWVWEAREREKIRQGIRRRIREANEHNRATVAAIDVKAKKAENDAVLAAAAESEANEENKSKSATAEVARRTMDERSFAFETPVEQFESTVDTSGQLDQLAQADQVQEVKRSARRPRTATFAEEEYTPEVNGGTDHWQGRDDEGYNINQDKIVNEGYGDDDSLRSMVLEPIPPKKKVCLSSIVKA
jgi:voltage-dependent calcium channel alpha-2/delta-3